MSLWSSLRRLSNFRRTRDAAANRIGPHSSSSRLPSLKHRGLRMEQFEDRLLLSITSPELVLVIPQEGGFVDRNEVLNVAPRDLVLRFNEGQEFINDTGPTVVDPNGWTTGGRGGIQVTRSVNGAWGDGDDEIVSVGWIGIGDRPNDVVLRFAESLPDDLYTVSIIGSDSYTGPDGQAVAPLRNVDLVKFRQGESVVDEHFEFELDLAPQVTAVVPQPVVVSAVKVSVTSASAVSDGDSFTISDGKSSAVFEFDTNGSSTAGNIAIDVAGLTTEAEVAGAIYQAVSGSALSVVSTQNGAEVSIARDASVAGSRVVLFGQDLPLAVTETREQLTDTIEVYFNDDDLFADAAADPDSAATNVNLYQLIRTQDSANPEDDQVFVPQTVHYDADLDRVVLVFAGPLAAYGEGAYRLRIGNEYEMYTTSAVSVSDAGDSFHTAQELASFGTSGAPESLILGARIDPQDLELEWPGAVDEPGQRDLYTHTDIKVEDHYMTGASDADAVDGVTTYYYNFKDDLPNGIKNLITPAQIERTREVFELYGNYLGVSFVETDSSGFTVATADLAAVGALSVPGGIGGIAQGSLAVMDKAESWGASEYGGSWFETAMHEIGHLLGYGHAFDLVGGTVMGNGTTEPVFPGNYDIIHGQHMYRPDSIDVDVYRFELTQLGTLSLEVLAERLNNASRLDSVITLYREIPDPDRPGTVTYEQLAQNDDYYSEDSFTELYLPAGVYYVGVSASGNDQYDSNVENTGIGGTSQGEYRLRLSFSPGGVDPDRPETFKQQDGDPARLLDATLTKFDGDADGVPGGVYSFWFNVASTENTLFVDKASTSSTQDGSLANPYKSIPAATAAANAGDIIRILGNNFADDDPEDPASYLNNRAYEIGWTQFDTPARALSDGSYLAVPQGVTVMVDAGAMFKMFAANIDVGSSASNIDRSGGALQILGTPTTSVLFTSHRDETLGVDTEPNRTTASGGDWGGLVFRNDMDYDYIENYDPATGVAPREVLETQGIFLNYVNHADMRYGGGQVTVNAVKSVYTPIHMAEARPEITHNVITKSADAAISGDPNSFADNLLQSWDMYDPFTADYGRVGPEIHGNTIVDNSINGMFIRIQTAAGNATKELEVPGRFDDWDVVHVLPENLVISSTPGGTVLQTATNSLTLTNESRLRAVSGQVVRDSDKFSIFDGSTKVVFEFELANGVTPGHFAIPFLRTDSASQIAAKIRTALASAAITKGLDVAVVPGESGINITLKHLGPSVKIEGFATEEARLDARLNIDPGIIVKLGGSRIETEVGAQFIAEGRPSGTDGAEGYKVVFTSLLDNRYGAGGTFNTSQNTSGQAPAPGDWAGLSFSAISTASLENAVIAYAGGYSAIEGGFARFDPIEARQASLRVVNSRFEYNDAGSAGNRNGRGSIEPATIFVRGSQPVLVNNDFLDNAGPIISVDADSMVSDVVADWGRSTGWISRFDEYASNHGPLVRGNRLTGNAINGMAVRGGTLTTESVWDDTDIVHVLRSEIVVSNYHHEGGLRLQSSADESLVVKLLGSSAGFTASGEPLEIDDRIGGSLQVVGMPGKPVVFTSLNDDTISAGFTLLGEPQFDTNGNGSATTAQAGDWRSLRLDTYSNDRNVAVVNETEAASQSAKDDNGDPFTAEQLGQLATLDKGGDDNLRLGFEIHGVIRSDAPDDVDVYTFDATAGTEIWIDIDWTTYALDTIVELIDADGNVLARSDNSTDEEEAAVALGANVFSMDKDEWLRHDFYTTNTRDAGMRLVLPGDAGETRTYYLRIRSALAIGNIPAGNQINDGEIFTISDAYQTVTFEFDKNGSVSNSQYVPVTIGNGYSQNGVAAAIRDAVKAAALPYSIANPYGHSLAADGRIQDGNVVLDGAHLRFDEKATQLDHLANTSGTYQCQVRLREMQEIPGSTVYFADIRYATDGIEVLGALQHSPLLGETSDVEGTGQGLNDTSGSAQYIGNLLGSDQNTISVAGYLSGADDIDWYRVTVDYQGIQSIAGINDAGSMFATIFDIDYAHQMARPDLTLWVFDQNGRLLFTGDGSNVAEDRPDPIAGASVEDLSRGSLGIDDPFIGSALLREGNGTQGSYLVAVTSSAATAEVFGTNYPLTRREPLNSLKRVAEEHFDGTYTPGAGGGPLGPSLGVTTNELTLGDVTMYVSTQTQLFTVDTFTGIRETNVIYPETALNERNPNRGYEDIMMRNDGWLFTLAGRRGSGNQHASVANYRQLSTEDGTIVQDIDEGITTYQLNSRGDGLEVYENGMRFHAMTYQPNSKAFIAVGSMDGGRGVEYKTNLVYTFRDTGAFTPDSPSGNRLTTNAVPRGQLIGGPVITAVAATQNALPFGDSVGVPVSAGSPDGSPDGDIHDGQTFELTDTLGNSDTFEFDLGFDVIMSPDGAADLRDGDTFVISQGGITRTFEFDSGPVLVFAGTLSNGDTIDVRGLNTQSNVQETRTVTIGAGNPAVPATIAGVATAINGWQNFAPDVVAVGNRLTFTGDTDITFTTANVDAIIQEGDYGLATSGTAISFEETQATSTVGQQIVTTLVAAFSSGTYASYAPRQANATFGDRLTINFLNPNSCTADFSGTPSFYHVPGSAPGASGANQRIMLQATASVSAVATAVSNAINNPAVVPSIATAAVEGEQVVLSNVAGVDLTESDPPLSVAGVGPGGEITGIAYVGNTLYAVSSNGGFYRVDTPTASGFDAIDPSQGYPYIEFNGGGPTLVHIATIVDGSPVNFQGLSAGPDAVEGGDYANVLFAVASNGTIYALNTEGELQPVFLGGESSVSSGITGAKGITFSPIDFNLWNETNRRSTDSGHGINATPDLTRNNTVSGGTSYYFGLEDPEDSATLAAQPGAANFIEPTGSAIDINNEAFSTYDLPGGGLGSLTTDAFSLEGYDPGDRPVLYFTYFLETEGGTDNDDFDGFKVYVSADGANWELAATNVDTSVNFTSDIEEQELLENTDSWRQACIDLTNFAGQSEVRVRFDFSTAADMYVGADAGSGNYLAAVAATKMADGEIPATPVGVASADWYNLSNDGRFRIGNQVFEFDMGHALWIPNAAGTWIHDEETFTINDGLGHVVTFEFDNPKHEDGGTAGTTSSSHVTIPIAAGLSTAEVVVSIVTAINNAVVTHGLQITPITDENRIFLKGAVGVTQTASPYTVYPYDSQGDVVILGDAPGSLSTTGALSVPLNGDMDSTEVAKVITKVVNQRFSGADLLQAADAATTVDGSRFRIRGVDARGEYQTVTFEFNKVGGVGTGNIAVNISSAVTADDVAAAIETAINNYHASSGFRVTATADGEEVTLHGDYTEVVSTTGAGVQHVNPYETTIKRDTALGYSMRLFGYDVTSPGPLGYSDALTGDVTNKTYPGDSNTRYRNVNRNRENHFEGVFIDDLIVGFSERGELVTAATSGVTGFTLNPIPSDMVTVGDYQLEIRRGEDFAQFDHRVPSTTLQQALDTNDRLAQGITVQIPAAAKIIHRDTFTISDGVVVKEFIFLDETIRGGFGDQIPIYYNATWSAARMAKEVLDAVVGVADFDVSGTSIETSNEIDLFGATAVKGLDYTIYGPVSSAGLVAIDFPKGPVQITGTVNAAAPNAADLLVTEILGPGVSLITGSASYIGGSASSGFWSDGTNSGILLTSGSVANAAGPNSAEYSTGQASLSGDADLNAEFGVTTLDTSALQFAFDFPGGDLFFDFVFASEEYNEYVYSGFNDVFGFFIEGYGGTVYPQRNIALVPGTTTPISIDTINGGDPYGAANAANEEYYNNNSPNDGGSFLNDLGYDGFTNVLTAKVIGLPAGQYVMKLVVSDVGDSIYDTGVFIKSGSFSNKASAQADKVTVVQTDLGDKNHERQKGQVILAANSITNSAGYGIYVAPGARDVTSNNPHPASGRSINEPNQLVPGIMIENNLIAYSGDGGILFSGDTGTPTGAIPFGRIVNNTIFGQVGTPTGTGILVQNNAGPTLLNNIVAGLSVGIRVADVASANNTVLGATLYQNNGQNVQGISLGTFDVQLQPGEPLFVDAAGGNFYPDQGSEAIDSSLNKMEDRADYYNRILAPIGIPLSPILAPEIDLYGQLRRDDLSVSSDSGLGQNVFSDRGAIDRVDFVAPTARITDPKDKTDPADTALTDRNPDPHDIKLVNEVVLKFTIQLADTDGVGIDDSSVVKTAIHLYRDLNEATYADVGTRDPELVEGVDYKFVYNATNDTIDLVPLSGVWPQGFDYTIVVDQTIRDRANNPLLPNRFTAPFLGMTVFRISLAGLDFGDAPDSYKVLQSSNGPRHVIWRDFYLGAGVTSETDATTSTTASIDPMDDGVMFSSSTMAAGENDTVKINVTMGNSALQAKYGNQAYVAAWFDFGQDGKFDYDPSSGTGINGDFYQVIQVGDGETLLNLPVPAGVDGMVMARFRFGSVLDEVKSVAGEASDGEVEDYVINVVDHPMDYGDAPDSFGTVYERDANGVVIRNGARHVIAGPTINALADADLNGQPSAGADGDDLGGSDDEDEALVPNNLIPGYLAPLSITVSESAYLDVWIDFDQNGVFEADEHPFSKLVNPGDPILVQIAEDAYTGNTFARFRITSNGLDVSGNPLGPDGLALSGEVEDHVVIIHEVDFGDAPDSSTTPTGHMITSDGPRLGNRVDHDAEAHRSPDALGDDSETTDPTLPIDHNGDDEDGIWFNDSTGTQFAGLPALIPGEDYSVTIDVNNADGVVYGWIDFDWDGNWLASEQIVSGVLVAAADGPQTFTFHVPNQINPGTVFARFRVVSTAEALSWQASPTGAAFSGEVEDYQVRILPMDYGDAPNAYGTVWASNGARHLVDVTGPYLGTLVDHDRDGAASTGAVGDDLYDAQDDEDGVTFSTPFRIDNPADQKAWVDIVAPNGGFVDVWIDFNGNGAWDNATAEHVVSSPVASGTQRFEFDVPDMGYSGTAYARVRITSDGKDADGNPLTPTGMAADGEVEDYAVFVDAAPVANAGGPYWINTDQDLWLDGSGSTDVDIPPDAIVWYQWDFTYDPSLPYDPADERTYFNPEFETPNAIDVIEWPWSDIIQVPQPRPEVALPVYLRVIDSYGAVSTVVDRFGQVVEGASAELYIFDNEIHAAFDVASESGGSPAAYAPDQTIVFDNKSTHDRGADIGFDKYLVTYEWDFDYDGTFVADEVQTAVRQDGSIDTALALSAGFGDTTHAYTRFGTYTAVMRVTDSNSPAKTAMYSRTITVTAGNHVPLADAGGPYVINVNTGLTLDGSASAYDDPAAGTNPASWGDSIVKWEWDLNNDGIYDFQGKQAPLTYVQLVNIGLAIPAAGEGYAVNSVQLRVTDSLGETDTTSTSVYIHENQPHAVADASAYVIAPGTAVQFDGTNSWHDRDPNDVTDHSWNSQLDRAIVRYDWDFDNNGTFDLAQSDPAAADFGQASYTYSQFGVYYATLRVTDNNTPVRRDYLDAPIQIVVSQGDVLPVANPGGPYRVAAGSGIVLDASGSYDLNQAAGDAITSYRWVLETGIGDQTLTASVPTYALTWNDLNGWNLALGTEYRLTLQVQDKAITGAVSADWSTVVETTLSVHSNAVFADLVVNDSDNTVACGFELAFDASGSDNPHPDREIVTYEWDFDYDGATFVPDAAAGTTSPTATHAFGQFGTYRVAVRATDDAGTSDIAEVTIFVSEGNSSPVADAGGPSVYLGEDAYFLDVDRSLTLDGSASYDPDAAQGDSIVSYQWDLDNDGLFDDATGATPTLTWSQLEGLGVDALGPHTISLKVTDEFGLAGTDTSRLVIFTNVPTAVINIDDADGVVGRTTPVDFYGIDSVWGDGSTAGRPDRQIVKYEWDFNGDGTFETVQNALTDPGAGVVENVTFPMYQTYLVSLRVTDDNLPAKTATTTISITVSEGNQDPEASISAPDAIEAGEGITLDGSASFDPDAAFGDAIVSYAWTVGGQHLVGVDQATVALTAAELVSLGLPSDGSPIPVSLTVTDRFGNEDTATDSFTISENAPNAVFTAAPNPVACNTSVAFDASGSANPHPDYDIVSYQWDFNYNGVSFDVDAEGQTTSHGFSKFGQYEVALRVTDNNVPAKTDIFTVTVSVSLGNRAPVADAGGPYVFGLDQAIVLNAGESSDPDQDYGDSIAAYRWDLDNDGSFDDATGPTVNRAAGWFSADQLHTIRLQVQDAQGGLLDEDVTTVTIVSNMAPSADAGGPYTVSEGTALVLDGTGSSDDVAITSYEWDLDYDGATFNADMTGAQPSVTFNDNVATRTIALRVKDGAGLSDIQTTTLTVANVDPTASIDGLPASPAEGQAVNISALVSDPGLDDTHTFAWTVTRGGTEVASGSNQSLSFTPADDGVYQIGLTVTDDDGGTDTVNEILTVVNADPAAGNPALAAVVTINGQSLIGAGQAVTLTGTFSDAGEQDTHTVSIVWDDGITSEATVDEEAGTYEASHTYAASGQYTIVATVADDDGGTDEATATLNVVNNLGTVDFSDNLADLDLSAGDLWFLLTAAHGGLLTVELGGTGASTASAALFGADGNAIAALADGPSDGTDFQVAAGASLYLKLMGTAADVDLRLTNLVSVDGAAVTVFGTDQDDTFEFEVASSHYVRINGTQYYFADVEGVAETVSFDGGVGTDSATFLGSEANESAVFQTGSGDFYSGSETYDQIGFYVDVTAENLVAYSGGGRDFAKMYDSPGNDTFTSAPEVSSLVGEGYSHIVHSFHSALGYATNRSGNDHSGGNDQAIMHGSAGKDKFKVDWADAEQFFGKLYGGTYYTRAKNFETIDADSSGGNDLAVVYGSPDNDEFYLTKGVGRMTNERTAIEFLGFNTVLASAGSGYDVITLEDTVGNDEMRGRSHKTTMIGSDYSLTARYFDEVYGEAKNGGNDKAKFHATAADDLLHAKEIDGKTWAQLAVSGTPEDMLYEALGFEMVRAYESEGDDKVDRAEDYQWLYLDDDWTDM